MPNPSFWPIVVAVLQGLFTVGFMLGRGDGPGFDSGAFMTQVAFQGVVGVLMLLAMYAWIKEDPFASDGAAH